MEPQELFDNWLEGTVHRDRQVDPLGVHLTVAEILTMHSRGRVDFGGGEMKPAGTHALEIMEQRPGDQYGWWRLDAGVYQVRFNERVKDGAPPMLLTANDRLVSCGCALAAGVCGPGRLTTVLTVPAAGISIKQNARIALLRTVA